MVLTRKQREDIFKHIVNNILEDDENGTIMKIFQHAKITEYMQYTTMCSEDIASLMEPGDKAEDPYVPIIVWRRNLLDGLICFQDYREAKGDPIIGEDWLEVGQAEFHEFRSKREYRTWFDARRGNGSSPTIPTHTTANQRVRSLAEEFKRGIKRDQSTFPKLKDMSHWDTYWRKLRTQAHAQDVAEVLNDTYVPINDADKDLFNEKQKFMYAVFEETILTDNGKDCVRKYVDSFNAQMAIAEIRRYAENSTNARLNAGNLMAYFITASVGDGTWKGTTEGFISNWVDKVRQYHELVTKEERFCDLMKKKLLQNAVHSIMELRMVQQQEETLRTHAATSSNTFTFENYLALLKSAAITYDSQFKPKPRDPRLVLKHQVQMDDAYMEYEDSITYDIDTPSSILQANAHARNRTKSKSPSTDPARLPFSTWKVMTPEEQKAWDQLSQQTKALVIGKRTVNLHDISAYEYLHSYPAISNDDTVRNDDVNTDDDSEKVDTTLLAHLSEQKEIPPSDVRRVLSDSISKNGQNARVKEKVQQANALRYTVNSSTYSVSNRVAMTRRGALIDRGANGGIAGDDVRVLEMDPHRTVDIEGIDQHQIIDIPIVTTAGVTQSQRGPVIIILHQQAYIGKGKSILSSGQLESYMIKVDDRSVKAGGSQCITTPDGYCIPLNIYDGLPYMRLRPPNDIEMDTLPFIILSSDAPWDPQTLDHILDQDEAWFDSITDPPKPTTLTPFDEYGNYRNRLVVQESHTEFLDAYPDSPSTVECIMYNHYQLYEYSISDKEPDYEALRPYFCWLPTDTIRATFRSTTQFARMPMSTLLKKRYKSPFPALNVRRRNEPVATDTIYSDTPAIDGGATLAQLYVGTESLLTDVYAMKSDREFINTLEDNIRERGAMDKIISDRAQVEISLKVKDILRSLIISWWQSEPHHQNQNPAERRYQQIKTTVNTVMDRTATPPNLWFLCLSYVVYVLNSVATSSLNNKTPLFVATGQVNDISPILAFPWLHPVYYKIYDASFPSDSREGRGRIVGIAEHVGHAMTWKILTDDTKKIIYRSEIRSAADLQERNLRMDPLDKDSISTTLFVKSRSTTNDIATFKQSMPILDPSDLIGRTFLMEDMDKDGRQFQAKIVEFIENHANELSIDPGLRKFRISVNDDQFEEILTYNELLDHINKQDDAPEEKLWNYSKIIGHEGPLRQGDKTYQGSKYNVMIQWENGETTTEPLAQLAADDPVSCAVYARDNNLLEREGWQRFKGLAKRVGKMLQSMSKAKIKSFSTAPKYQYGYEIPRDYTHAVEIDKRNGNSLWQDSIALEMQQLYDYATFEDMGQDMDIPADYKRIRVHFVFAVKHDGRHKARLVADGHLTDIPNESVYSGVVSLRGIRLIIFIAELNNMEIWATDVGNAYLEAYTNEKVYIKAGPEFGTREGTTLKVVKALYGLRTSGLRWHERFADCLRQMGFQPSFAESDIWMRRNDDLYDYIAAYVDDLAIASKNPKSIIDELTNTFKFKLKGTGPISFHLGCDFSRDDNGTLCIAPRKYIEKMIKTYEGLFGTKPKAATSPLEKGDHPEFDTTDLLDENHTQIYQSLIGALQWAVTLARFDIATAVMTLSSFRVAPRIGHLTRVRRVYGYLMKFRHGTIRIRTGEPDYSGLPNVCFDWSQSIYGTPTETIPPNIPEPLGEIVVLTHYVDANLFHCKLTGRSVTGILDFVNQTPIDWYSKKQATVETATYGSEFVAARICVERDLDLRTTLRYLGVRVRQKAYMFGDNESVVNSSTTPHARLHKRHNALSFHRVREAIAANMIAFYHIRSENNPADVVSKHWGYQQIWPVLQPILFWQGDTLELIQLQYKCS